MSVSEPYGLPSGWPPEKPPPAGRRRRLRWLADAVGRTTVGLVVLAAAAGGWMYGAGRYVLAPGETAVLREVFVRQGVLFGPSAAPFRVRVETNSTPFPRSILLQPAPFGTVEEVLRSGAASPLSVQAVQWRKDQVTGQKEDAGWVRAVRLEAVYYVEEATAYASRLDPLRTDLRDAEDQPFSTRPQALAELVRTSFDAYLAQQVTAWAEEFATKAQFLLQIFAFGHVPDQNSARQSYWTTYLGSNPWFAVSSQGFAAIQEENPEILQSLGLLLQLMASGFSEEQLGPAGRQTLEEARRFFRRYLENHPEHDDRPLWAWLIGELSEEGLAVQARLGASLEQGSEGELGRLLAVRYAEDHLSRLAEGYAERLREGRLLEPYGVRLDQVSLSVADDAAAKHPQLAEPPQGPREPPAAGEGQSPRAG